MKQVPSLAPTNCQDCPRRQQSLLGCCQLAELNLVSTTKTFQTYQKGQVIFREGSRLNSLYCIFEGKVKMTKTGGDGKAQIMRFTREGDTMGFRALMSDAPYACSAVALEDCVVCMVPRTDVLSLMEQNTQFTRALLRHLTDSLNETETRMLHMTYKPVRERLAGALLLLHRTFCLDSGNCAIPISREDLASLIGTATETASRLVSEFKEEGLIATKGSKITILNAATLTQISTQYD
ncbi:Crp/Fnr family transcriptional regulator [Hymenobacter edaphi]|uniref:Crp/Fnr family transcriptional regulator n=1 Tax=Hymenobacter edaphi TaxID=2211146 RepID=A0A328BM06_9BACT|nr:Crp/Fnr family transcriptional regulator [Hymenobacter edaphi]RAK68153.1 Crp/Fnr family transcriptional regulator [Hymenobacter edaphi]